MATARPFMQMGIGELENLFKTQGESPEILARLKHELSFRQVPRAVLLLERIQKTKPPVHSQDDVSSRPNSVNPVMGLDLPSLENFQFPRPPVRGRATVSPARGLPLQVELPDLFHPVPKNVSGDLSSRSEPESDVKSETQGDQSSPKASDALPQLSLEDACRILKVSANDGWEKIETARRSVVTRSSPFATKGLTQAMAKKLLAEARLANDATMVISARRSGRV